MRRLLLSCLFLLLFPIAAAAQFACPMAPPAGPISQCGNPEFQSCGIDVNGITRHFCIHEPAFPDEDVPVVWGFHGSGGQASRAVNWLEDQTGQGMVLVAPTALPSYDECTRRWRHLSGNIPTWADFANANTCATGPGAPSGNGVDLEFVLALMDEIDAQLDVATHHALGFSNGGSMVFQLMITDPFATRFAGFGTMGIGINDEKIQGALAGAWSVFSADPEARRPVIMQMGTADKTRFPGQQIIETINLLASTAQAGDPCDLSVITVERSLPASSKSRWRRGSTRTTMSTAAPRPAPGWSTG